MLLRYLKPETVGRYVISSANNLSGAHEKKFSFFDYFILVFLTISKTIQKNDSSS